MSTETSAARVVRAPRGTKLTCKAWPQEAAYRMVQNNLDPDVAERPEDLVVYGGTGKAARTWTDFDRILTALQGLESDETLLVQSGRPVGIALTHPDAPRVLIANSMLVPHWATWDEFRRLEAAGLTMFGQMTAGSWIYIGTQGILQGTYETFGACARKHFGGSLVGRLLVTGGLGGMGGAQPLAVTMNGGVCLAAEVDPGRVERRLETAYLDRVSADLDEALRWCDEAVRRKEALSVGYIGNAADLLAELIARDLPPDVLTDQTSAHDELNGYIPNGVSYEEALALRVDDPKSYARESMRTMADHVRSMLTLQERGAVTFDYGNNIRGQAIAAGVDNALDIIGFVPAYIRPLFAKARDRFAGWHFPVTQRISPAPTRPFSRLFPTTSTSHVGSGSRKRKCTSKACLRGFAGSPMASGPRWDSCSTISWRRARSKPPSLSDAIISIAARWRHPTARPRG